jgi:thymidylate synthase (FAD)
MPNVKLIDMMGDESRIVQVARLSRKSEGSPESDERLLRHLVKCGHTTPLEFVQFTFWIKCPILVARQWMRHRTGTFLEKSLRYTTEEPEFYTPEEWRGNLSEDEIIGLQESLKSAYSKVEIIYRAMSQGHKGQPEQVRIILPLGTMTEFYWRVDAHNLINGFLRQRLDKAAQAEMREYAQAVAEIVSERLPVVWAATLAKWGDG